MATDDGRKAFSDALGKLLQVPKKELDREVLRSKKRRLAKKQSRKEKR
jgi:hypothetical protein